MMYKIDEAKSFFFDRPTIDGLHKDAKRGLARFGAFVRRKAKSSMRKARQKKLAELTSEELQRFRIEQEYAKRENRPAPKRPLAPSEPGQPPRTRVGLIKELLFFSYDPNSRSVVVGPATIDTPSGAPENLEEGATVTTRAGRFRIEKRPYMKPAFDANLSKLPRLMAGQTR